MHTTTDFYPVRSLEIINFISKKIRVLATLLQGYDQDEADVFLKELLEVVAAKHFFDVSVSIENTNSLPLPERIVLEICSLLQLYYSMVANNGCGSEIEIKVHAGANLFVEVKSGLTMMKTDKDLLASASDLVASASIQGWQAEFLSGVNHSRLYLKKPNEGDLQKR